MRSFFILWLISSHKRSINFFYFYGWSAVIAKYKKFFSEKYKEIFQGVFFRAWSWKNPSRSITIMFWKNIRIFSRKFFFPDLWLESAAKQKIKFSIKDFFSKCDQIRRKPSIKFPQKFKMFESQKSTLWLASAIIISIR